jgi:hypothetical protein
MILWSCGGDDNGMDNTPAPLMVAKATCGANDKPETGLQGQVPAAIRAAGFNGFSCNLQLIGQYKGEGASWQHAWFQDKAGHLCNYYDTAASTVNRTQPGTVVIDATDPTKPHPTTYLTSRAMLDPWESLKVNPNRQVLGGTEATNAVGTNVLELYDLSGDCRFPQLLTSTAVGTVANGDADALPTGYTLVGHEGNVAPDGLTWYNGNRGNPKNYTAIDMSNMTHPKLLTTWDIPLIPTTTMTTHGLSVREDGNRAYVSWAGVPGANVDLLTTPEGDGMIILDTSDVQKRLPNPKMRQVGIVTWRDGGQMQHTIPVTIGGKSYVIAVDESGPGGLSPDGWAASCAAGLAPFNAARIIDISDETKPVVVSKLFLETHDPKNCDKVLPDLAGLSSFTYGSHYCSVDNKRSATTLACGYFNSGIRVFDIRDPLRPKEIAYFNPPGATVKSNGSNHAAFFATGGWVAGGPDWCSAQIRLDAATASLQTTCQDNGFLSLKFTNGVWPFPETTTPPGLQN